MSQQTSLKRCWGPRFTFANKLLKNTKELKQGLVKICWEGTREKIIWAISCSIVK